MDPEENTRTGQRKREERLSTDGNWRSFPKVPHLLQYVPSGTYYGRTKVHGKIVRQSLETGVWSDAKLRLTDFIKQQQEARREVVTPKFSEAAELLKKEVEQDNTLKPRSKEYRLLCVQTLQRSWPGIWDKRLGDITVTECREWAAQINKRIASQYFNNVIGTLRMIFAAGIKAHKEATGVALENPGMEIKRVKVRQKDLKLPEPSRFRELVENVRLKSGGWGHRAADLVEFLAYSGMRLRTEAQHVTWEDVDWDKKEIIVRGDPETGTKNWEIRRIPIIPDMETLLKRLSTELGSVAKGKILQIGRCHESLARVCKEMGMKRLTHHDFRHLFATRCIESGVDILTVSRWLGHKDGGILAMRTYGHLRNEHSQAMAQRVKF